MALRGSRLIPSTVTRTLLCVDYTQDSELYGRVFNPYMKETPSFKGSKQLIEIMEAFFDEISFPQEYYTLRSFGSEKKKAGEQRKLTEITRYHEDSQLSENKGELTTILFEVRFRQNAEWQGDVEWNGISKQFRSILTFLLLVDNAVEQDGGKLLSQQTWGSGDNSHGLK